ncbi:MAG TPA: flavodoxin domain-containing protein [Ktedonobacterales bacterium]|jgi:menaquinone-dependent protoporphyrinogen oxidase
MTVLVTYASKHGSTEEIAERITATLRRSGIETDLQPVEAVRDVEPYAAIVLGSAIYYGSWLKEAREFVHHYEAALATRPVWLFSSGPLGVEVKDAEPQPKEYAEFKESVRPRDPRIFFGALDYSQLSFMERMVVKGVRAPEGDFRDWPAIEEWAESIAHALQPTPAPIAQN